MKTTEKKHTDTEQLTKGKQTLPKSNILRCCNDLLYESFKKICVDNDLSLLGEGTEQELTDAWVEIYSEFFEICGDESISSFVQLKAEYLSLQSKFSRVIMLCNLLVQSGYDENVCTALSDSGYKHDYKNDLAGGIDTTIRKLRNVEVKMLELGKRIHEKETVKNGASRKRTYAEFDEHISVIERTFKVSIDVTKLSTQMYAIKIKECREHIERNNWNALNNNGRY